MVRSPKGRCYTTADRSPAQAKHLSRGSVGRRGREPPTLMELPAQNRVGFEKPRGVTAVTARGDYAYLVVHFRSSTPPSGEQVEVYRLLAEHSISINRVKHHQGSLSFEGALEEMETTDELLQKAGDEVSSEPSVSIVTVQAGGMRGLWGVMAKISRALLNADVRMVQTGDGPDIVFCLVPSAQATIAVRALRAEFNVPEPQRPFLVQKFGGRSVGTAEARQLAAERVAEALAEGYCPVVVVSAIGRMGDPYATDTLLAQLAAVSPDTPASPRERDLLMACGEILSTAIMAQTLKTRGIRAVALTGGQAGILTDCNYGDAQILEINPAPIRKFFDREPGNGEQADVVVVAGFQGVEESGAITTLGRGGSDTTASALGAALGAERVEIYTHVDGVMTADPEVDPSARTLDVVTYEEVCNMAHQGAKVIHPRAVEIAMRYQIPLWVKTSFERKRGTRIAPLEAIKSPQTGVTGVATVSKLAYFTVTGLGGTNRLSIENEIYRTVGDAEINFYLNSLGPSTSSFLVEQGARARTAAILESLGLKFRVVEDCEMVSLVALNMWEAPGFLLKIAEALSSRDIPVMQMADSECSVSCLVSREDGPRAVRALHEEFRLGR